MKLNTLRKVNVQTHLLNLKMPLNIQVPVQCFSGGTILMPDPSHQEATQGERNLGTKCSPPLTSKYLSAHVSLEPSMSSVLVTPVVTMTQEHA